MQRLDLIHDQRGTTLIELLVATLAGVVVFFAICVMVIVSLRETARTTTHVEATQRARLVIGKVIEELHSACVAPQITPIQEGSNGTLLSFWHQTGSAVAPTPVLSKVVLKGTTLSQEEYPVVGGSAPDWVPAKTASRTETLMTNVSPTPPSTSIFSYYAYSNGEVGPTPLAVPLNNETAPRTVEVGVALSAAPKNTPIADETAPTKITDSALLRFTPASYNTSAPSLPCQ